MKKLNSDQEILKLIDTQIKFADVFFKDFRGKRYGMNTCSVENFNRVLIDQYVCSWQSNKAAYSGNPETTYKSTKWRRRMDPLYSWVTYGEFEGNNPCTGICDNDYTCIPYTPPHTYLTLAVKISSNIVNTIYLPNASGSAVLYAQVGDNTSNPSGELNWRCVGSVALTATNNGDLWLPIHGDNPFTGAVDGPMASESIRFILRDGCKVYQIIFPDSEWAIDSQGYNAFPPASDDAFWNCNLEAVLQNNMIFDACKTYTITQYPIIKTLCDACYGGRDADCVYCGTELLIEEIPQSHSVNQSVICIDDQECIHITVKDQCGNPIKDYDIYIDNKYIGKTNDQGKISTTILQASTNWNHLLNFCYCFTTTGLCNQQKLDMVVHVDGIECEDCKPVQKCENAVKPLSEPILVEEEIINPYDPDGPTMCNILCFTCDEENPAFTVGTYLQVPCESVTDCSQVAPIGYWVNSIADCEPDDICGCTDPIALNYDPNANIPCDGFNCFKCETTGPNCCCIYPSEEELRCGCADPTASNYGSTFNADCDCTPLDETSNNIGAVNCCNYPSLEPPDGYIIKTGHNYKVYRNTQMQGANVQGWMTQAYSETFGAGINDPQWFFLPIYISDFFFNEWSTNGWFNPLVGNSGCQYSWTDGLTNGFYFGTIGTWMYDIKIQYDPRYIQPGTTETVGANNSNDGGMWGVPWTSDALSVANYTDFALQGRVDGSVFDINIDTNPAQEPNGFGVYNSNNRNVYYYTVDQWEISAIRVRFPASIAQGLFQQSMDRPILWIPWRIMEQYNPGGEEIINALANGDTWPITLKFGVTWVPPELEGEYANGSHLWNTVTMIDGSDCMGGIANLNMYGLLSSQCNEILEYPIFDYTNYQTNWCDGIDDGDPILNFAPAITKGYGYNENTGENTEGEAVITLSN